LTPPASARRCRSRGRDRCYCAAHPCRLLARRELHGDPGGLL